MSFSRRHGFSAEKIIQKESIDNELKNKLWNVVQLLILSLLKDITARKLFCIQLWNNFFKDNIKTMFDVEYLWEENCDRIYEIYEKRLTWYEVYDFIEFIANMETVKRQDLSNSFILACNRVLEEERSAYRFVNGLVTAIISKEEIKSIEDAVNNNSFSGVKEHLEQSLILLSDKQHPDFRNSIKESISAVESICVQLVGKEKATLGEALNIISKEGSVDVHPALVEAFKKLYGYTSDADGIRHALIEESNIKYEDALFMLVSSSAFINYLISKTNR